MLTMQRETAYICSIYARCIYCLIILSVSQTLHFFLSIFDAFTLTLRPGLLLNRQRLR